MKKEVKTKKEKVTKEKKEKKLKFNIKPIIFIAVLLCLIGLSYYFLGLIATGIIFFFLIIILLIGHALDKPKSKGKRKKVLKILLIIFLTLCIIGLVAGCLFIFYIVKNAPDFATELLKSKESTIIYDSQGNEYAKLGTEIRENITYDQISEEFVDALIATEDSRFFQHNGFDFMRFTKAAIGQAMGNGDAGGGSTLTMQVAKNTFTDASADSGIKGIIRKFTDIYISIFQIERNYTKEEIIEFYINNHDLVGVISGIQEASQYFFGKDAKDLNLAESSLLAGLYQAPTYYNPRNYPERAEKRRSTVLYLMVKHGYITDEERKIAESIPVSSMLVKDNTKQNEYQAYIDLVCKEIQENYGVDPYSTPMLIYSNMIRSKQNGMNDIMNGKTFKWKDNLIQSGIVVLDTETGKVEAVGAGRNRTGAKSYSYATDINRQIGSTAKPLFDYGPGMEYNNWSTYTTFLDEPYTYSSGKAINNYDYKHKGLLTLRQALSDSRNIPALKAFQQVDNKKIIEFVTNVGITPEISNGAIHEAHAIGAFTGSNPLSMAGAYQIFSNGGYYIKPTSVNKIIFRNTGEVIEVSSPKTRVISDSTAYMITDVLKGVETNSTTRNGLGKDKFAVKTGTTNVDSATKKKNKLPSSIVRDYWIIGYTHNTVITVWLGYDELNSKHYLNYSHDGSIRRRLLNAAGKIGFDHDNKDFTRPKSVVSSKVEIGSDPPMLPSANTPSDKIKSELFKRGTEPTQVSPKYLKLQAPSNFKVSYKKNSNSVLLTWSAVADQKYVEDAVFGYYIYFNGEKLFFTDSTSYTISTFTSYIGKYEVRAGYQNTNDCMSNPSTYTLDTLVNYELTFQGKTESTYNINEYINPSLYNGGILRLTADGVNITNSATINITITNGEGNTVTTIDNSVADVFTITYDVRYDTFQKKVTSKISIIDKENPPDEEDGD